MRTAAPTDSRNHSNCSTSLCKHCAALGAIGSQGCCSRQKHEVVRANAIHDVRDPSDQSGEISRWISAGPLIVNLCVAFGWQDLLADKLRRCQFSDKFPDFKGWQRFLLTSRHDMPFVVQIWNTLRF